tara:strand:+ start:42481 stop:43209 length:729 start_codon:yes stop_codon:yes gene_type:complete
MPRLEIHRYLFAGLIVFLWLGPPTFLWLVTRDFYGAVFPALRGAMDVATLPWRELNALVLSAGLMLSLLTRPAQAGPLAAGGVTNGQRGEAAATDIAVLVLVFARPLDALLVTFNPYYSGTDGLDAWLASPPWFGDIIWAVPAWLVYTAIHLMLRRQTIGQVVAGYRLVHTTPLGSWQEALYQTCRVVLHVVGDAINPARRFRQGKHLTPELADAQDARERTPPGWYASAGVTTEVARENRK